MIWTIVSKAEMEGYKIPPVFQYYREVIGKENISLAVVDEDDPLDFVKPHDVILLRTASERLIESIERKGVASTAESYSLYRQVQDKAGLGQFLKYGVLVPYQFTLGKATVNRRYFVKPRYGSESFGITPQCICNNQAEVAAQVERLYTELGQESVIEEYVDGIDCTVACYYDPLIKDVRAHAIKVECDEVGGIQTHVGKFDYNEYCSPLYGDDGRQARAISRNVFRLLGIRHHARIDYRLSYDGRLYLIDVNLLPGLGPSAHFSKCLLLTENISYMDAIKSILKSSS